MTCEAEWIFRQTNIYSIYGDTLDSCYAPSGYSARPLSLDVDIYYHWKHKRKDSTVIASPMLSIKLEQNRHENQIRTHRKIDDT